MEQGNRSGAETKLGISTSAPFPWKYYAATALSVVTLYILKFAHMHDKHIVSIETATGEHVTVEALAVIKSLFNLIKV